MQQGGVGMRMHPVWAWVHKYSKAEALCCMEAGMNVVPKVSDGGETRFYRVLTHQGSSGHRGPAFEHSRLESL